MAAVVSVLDGAVRDGRLVVGTVEVGTEAVPLDLAVNVDTEELDTAALEELEAEGLLHYADECAEALMTAEVAS